MLTKPLGRTSEVRKYVLKCLAQASDDELVFWLPQIVQSLRTDSNDTSSLRQCVSSSMVFVAVYRVKITSYCMSVWFRGIRFFRRFASARQNFILPLASPCPYPLQFIHDQRLLGSVFRAVQHSFFF